MKILKNFRDSFRGGEQLCYNFRGANNYGIILEGANNFGTISEGRTIMEQFQREKIE